ELATGGSTSGPGGPGVPNGILSSTGDANRYSDTTATGASSSHLALDGGQPHSSFAAGVSAIGSSNPHARSSRAARSHQPEGTIENLQVVSGHPLLVRAAIEAVRQWRYRPYVLNGEAVEVETQVTVNFVLSGG